MIRLLNAATLQFEIFADSETVSYAILSHRWRDDEVRYEDMALPNVAQMKGYQKIVICCRQALSVHIKYVWVDTCCIDKRSSAELSEAINSMFRWYQDSTECYAYLDDVTNEEDLSQSEWFTRCWTLQELIAPKKIIFFKKDWKDFGTKRSLRFEIASITKIPQRVLKGGRFSAFSVAQRMSWAAGRRCTQIEDEAYSLLGLFDVNMPLIYGERRKAFSRLQEEIIKHSDDHTIFAWSNEAEGYRGILATSPSCFSGCHDIVEANPPIQADWELSNTGRPHEMTSHGLYLHLNLFRNPVTMDTYVAQLNCKRQNSPDNRIGIYLCQVQQHLANSFARVTFRGQDIVELYEERMIHIGSPRSLFVVQNERTLRTLRRNKLDFSIASHYSFTLDSPYPIEAGSPFLNMAEGTTGHIATLHCNDLDSRIGAAVLGFDSNLYPMCILFDREAAASLPERVKSYDYTWTEERIQHSHKPVSMMLWRVAHMPGIWFLHVPARRLNSSDIQFLALEDNEFFLEVREKVPSNLEPFLCVYIEELEMVVRIARERCEGQIAWVLRLMKPDHCSDCIGTIFDAPTATVEDKKDILKPVSLGSYLHSDDWIQMGIRANKDSAWGELAELFCGGLGFDPSLQDPTALAKFQSLKKLGLAYELLRVPEGERQQQDKLGRLNTI